MHKIKQIVVALIIFSSFLFILFFNNNNLHKKIQKEEIKIGVSDDTSGFVTDYIVNKNNFYNAKISNVIEPIYIRDC